ncbi:hypothetical protein P261_00179 [Lachnospiraceae bacterium TWA4]|nr:hypothetical protein P261_00179 [Lachnospiraceae bacterium TWA4]
MKGLKDMEQKKPINVLYKKYVQDYEKEVLAKADELGQSYVAKKEYWIGFKVTQDFGITPDHPSFPAFLDMLHEKGEYKLVNCLKETVELATKLQ